MRSLATRSSWAVGISTAAPANAGGLSRRTGTEPLRTTAPATLPITSRDSPLLPCVAMTINPAPCSLALAMMASAGSPMRTSRFSVTLPGPMRAATPRKQSWTDSSASATAGGSLAAVRNAAVGCGSGGTTRTRTRWRASSRTDHARWAARSRQTWIRRAAQEWFATYALLQPATRKTPPGEGEGGAPGGGASDALLVCRMTDQQTSTGRPRVCRPLVGSTRPRTTPTSNRLLAQLSGGPVRRVRG